jgi:HEAT repeat protein
MLVLALVSWFLIPRLAAAGSSGEEDDEKTLAKAHVRSEGSALLDFLQKRTLSETEREHLEQQVQDLGNKKFVKRSRASRELIARGAAALPFLQQALSTSDVEVVNRARKCIAEIRKLTSSHPDVPAAAVRQLVRIHPPKTVTALLDYLPYADNEAVSEEVIEGLLALSQKPNKIDPALVSALDGKRPVQCAAAAYVLAQVGDDALRTEVRRLLQHRLFPVRFRAAHGLLAVRDKSAVPVLIDLVRAAPAPVAWQAQDLLARVAMEKTPGLALNSQDAGARKKAAAAWETWWREQGPTIDWKQLDIGLPGGALVAELESNTLWESGPGGKTRWEIEDLQGPYDMQMLGGGRVLVAEYLGGQVTERDRKGTVLWKKEIDRPVSCRRLPNGHTFIATTRGVVELAADGREVFAHTLQKTQLPVYCAYRPTHGSAVYIVCEQGFLAVETGQKKVTEKRLDVGGQVSDVQGLVNGNLLLTVTVGTAAKVVEVSPAGKTVWETKVPGVCSATRLVNGNILAVSKSGRVLVQVDATGRVLWQKRTDGRPIRVQRR